MLKDSARAIATAGMYIRAIYALSRCKELAQGSLNVAFRLSDQSSIERQGHPNRNRKHIDPVDQMGSCVPHAASTAVVHSVLTGA